jgi:hypothetical protein
MIEIGTLRAQTHFDVSKDLPKGQLSERHAQELIQVRKGLHFERASIADDATTEGGQRKMLHQLRKHQLASVHRWPPKKLCFAGSQNQRSEFKLRPREFAAYPFLINNLRKARGKTLGHY